MSHPADTIPRDALRRKIAGLVACVAAAVLSICALGVYFPLRQVDDAERALAARATSYAEMLALQSRSAVAFDDHVTAREAFEGVAGDPDVALVAVMHEDGRVIESLGDHGPGAVPPVTALRVERRAGVVRVVTPIASLEGPRGTLVLELSRAPIAAQRRRALTTAAGLGLLGAFLGLLGLWAAATTMRFGRALSERTVALDRRNRDLREVLDNVGQGFITMDRAGLVGAERSATADRWLGAPADGATFWSWTAAVDASFARWFEIGWSACMEGFLPAELTLDQLPRELTRGAQTLRCEYLPLMVGDEIERLLIVVSDVSDERARQRAEATQRELASALQVIARDRAGFAQFFDEAGRLVQALSLDGLSGVEARRAVHTLKGNCAMFRLTAMAAWCHEVESSMVEDQRGLREVERAELTAQWVSLSEALGPLVGRVVGSPIEVSEPELDALVAKIQTGASRRTLALTAEAWRHEPVERPLRRLGAAAEALAMRLGRDGLMVRVEADGVRLPTERWGAFWAALVHVVRNAVDHGIEAAEDRAQIGKPRAGTLVLRAHQRGAAMRVEIEDDGRGIDWERLLEQARRHGLRTDTHGARERALFADGVSTRDVATDTSGRGIGMSAVQSACERLGGSIEVESQPGRGTRFVFTIPEARLAEPVVESRGASLPPPAN